MTQLRLPSYEEICGGATGPYVAPPPYTEQDPNKSNTSLEGASHLNATVAETSQSSANSEETSNASSTPGEISESNSNRVSQSNTTSGAGQIHLNAYLAIAALSSGSSARLSVLSSETDTQTLSSTQISTQIANAQTPAVAGSSESQRGPKSDPINQTEQNKDETLISDRDKEIHSNLEV